MFGISITRILLALGLSLVTLGALGGAAWWVKSTIADNAVLHANEKVYQASIANLMQGVADERKAAARAEQAAVQAEQDKRQVRAVLSRKLAAIGNLERSNADVQKYLDQRMPAALYQRLRAGAGSGAQGQNGAALPAGTAAGAAGGP